MSPDNHKPLENGLRVGGIDNTIGARIKFIRQTLLPNVNGAAGIPAADQQYVNLVAEAATLESLVQIVGPDCPIVRVPEEKRVKEKQ